MADFRRDDKGTPLVAHPTETVNRGGTKGELVAEARAAGHQLPSKITVDELRRLLGPRPKSVKYARPSNYVKVIENTYNLERWSERQVVEGVAIALATPAGSDIVLDGYFPDERIATHLIDLLALSDDKDRKARADELVAHAEQIAKANLAADRGTHAHMLTELDDEGRDWIAQAEAGELLGLDPGVQASLVGAWRQLLDRYGLEVLAVEQPIVNDEYKAAGTLDRIVKLTRPLRFILPSGELVNLPAGEVVVLDLKTGKTPDNPDWWNGYAAQIFLYASGVPYDPATDRRLTLDGAPYDPPSIRWGLLAHVDVLGALDGADSFTRLLLVDLDAGAKACRIAREAKAWSKTTGVFGDVWDDGKPIEPVAADDREAPVGHPPAADVPTAGSTNPVPDDAPPSSTVEPTPGAGHGNSTAPGADLTPAEQLAATPADPDDGGDCAGPLWDALQHRYLALSDNAVQWITDRMREAMQAGVTFHAKTSKTARRYALYDCVITIAEKVHAGDHAETDLVVRALIALAVCADWPLYPRVTVGHALGALDAYGARQLSAAVVDYLAGTLVADLSRGVIELRHDSDGF